MSRREVIIAALALAAAFLLWSHAFLAVAMLRRQMGAVELMELRFLPAGLMAAILAVSIYPAQCREMIARHAWRVVAGGVLLVLGYNLTLHHCLAFINPGAAALLTSFVPLFTMFLAFDLLKEPFTLRRACGAFLALDGMFVVVLFGRVGAASRDLVSLGELPYAMLLVAACLAQALGVILSKPLTGRYPPMAVNFMLLAAGALPLGLTALDGRLVGRAATLGGLR